MKKAKVFATAVLTAVIALTLAGCAGKKIRHGQ
jgi:predicted small lipoprotein YifL